MSTFVRTLVIGLLAVACGLPATAGQGREKSKGRGKGKGRPAAAAASVSNSDAVRWTRSQVATIRDWFADPENTADLPPGLAKREELPPGLQRQLRRNGTLPPGLQRKVQPVPYDLKRRLPKPPDGVDIVWSGGNVILIEARTKKVLDIVANVKVRF